MPHIGYKLQLAHNYLLHNLITTHYHHSHTTELHAYTKENTSKYSNKYTDIQIKVELRCPCQFSPDGREFDPVESTAELLCCYRKFISCILNY